MKSGLTFWEKTFSRASSRYAFILLLSFILAVPPFIIARLSYLSIKKELTEYSIARKQNKAKLAALMIRERLERIIDLAISLSTRVQFQKQVNAGDWAAAVKIMEAVPQQFDYIERIFLTDAAGTIMADTPALGQTVGVNFAHRDWYKGVANGWRPYMSGAYQRQAEPKYTVVSVASPIFSDVDPALVVGILVAQIRVDTFFRWVQDFDMEPGGALIVMDNSGGIVTGAASGAYQGPGNLKDFAPARAILAGNNGTMTTLDPQNSEELLCAFESIANFQWGVLVVYPTQAAFQVRDHILLKNRAIFAVFMAINLLLIVLFMRGLDRSILMSVSLRKARDGLEERVSERTQELKRSRDELLEINKELEQFAYVASHDLQEPLRKITSFAQLFSSKYSGGLDEAGKQYIRYVIDGGKRMEQLIKDLLNYARTSTAGLQKEPTDANTALQTALANLSELIKEKKAKITHDKLPTVMFHRGMLAMVFENLVSNAIKYVKDESPFVHISVAQDSGYWVMAVKDNGIGIEEKHYERIFEIFERLHLDNEYSGTGMGLAVIRRILERHGGKISVESTPGTGSTFKVYIKKNGT